MCDVRSMFSVEVQCNHATASRPSHQYNFNSLLFRQTHLLGYVENKKNILCMYYNKNKYTIYLENKKNTIFMETYRPPCTLKPALKLIKLKRSSTGCFVNRLVSGFYTYSNLIQDANLF